MAEKVSFFPLDFSYEVVQEGNRVNAVVYIYGRTKEGKQICVIDNTFDPYFYVVPREGEDFGELRGKIDKLNLQDGDLLVKVLKTEIVNMKIVGKEVKVIKVVLNIPRGIPKIREVVHGWENIENTYEYDILFVRRYRIDKGIVPMTLCEAEGEFVKEGKKMKVQSFKADSLICTGSETLQKPKILGVDIETHSSFDEGIDMEKNPIIMLALYGENYKKVLVWKKFETSLDYVEFVEDERELLEKFKKIVNEFKPDIIGGYYSDGFDLPYIKRRAEILKVKLDIGLDYSNLKIGKGNFPTAYMVGITHLDIFKFIKKVSYLTLDSFDLNTVASALLEEKKVDVDLANLYNVWNDNPEQLGEYCEYNLKDARLVYDLSEKMMPTIVEMVKIVGVPIFDINRMGYSQLVEWYTMKEAFELKEIAPNKPGSDELIKRRNIRIKGAFVFEPKPGLYRDIEVFDYRSLYPTIISSHNIGPSTLKCDCCEDGKFEIEGKGEFWFCKKKKGMIPELIKNLIEKRGEIKKIIKDDDGEKFAFLDARQNSLKLMANSFYGYLGFYGARWYSFECAESTTGLGRKYVQSVMDKAEAYGFGVVYGDSLPYNRNIWIKFENGEIKLIKIGELYDHYRNNKSLCTLSLDKECNVNFKPIINIIRHKSNEKLLKINSKYGSTIVTPQHSVYSYDYKENKICLVDAKELKIGDRLISLTNPKLEVTYIRGHIFDMTDLNMGIYSDKLKLYSDDLIFPAIKDKCPYCNKVYSLAAHIYLKHKERREEFNKKSLFSWVGGIKANVGKIPRYWELDEDLAWVLGYYCADGSVSNVKTKTGRKTLLSFGSQDKKLIEKVKKILDKKTKRSTKIIEDYDKRIGKYMYYYRIQRIPIVALFQFGFGAGKGSENKKIPWFIFSAEKSLREAFLKGYLDGDGQSNIERRYKTHFIRFSTKSKELAIGLDYLLKCTKFKKNKFQKEIKHVYWLFRKDKPKIQTLRFQSSPESKGNYCLSEIYSINKIPSEKYVYDLEVKGVHNFVDAEGMILVHNTDSCMITLGDKTREDGKKFAKEVNENLPGLMELEFEGYYPSGIFVSAKASGVGAKKKYALMNEEGKMKVRGFEAVRRNWSAISKEVQEKVLEMVMKEHKADNALEYVRKVVGELRDKKISIEKVTMRTQLTKEIEEYTARGPHVAVAERMRQMGKNVGAGTVIKYVVTQGKDIIRNRSKLPEEVEQEEYDADYYINHQVIPAVERIFDVLEVSKDEIGERKDQSKLANFF